MTSCTLKQTKRIPFTQVYNETVTDHRLTSNAFRVLVYMLGQADGWQFNCNDIRTKTNLGKEACAAAMKCLEQAGYLNRTKTQAGGGRFLWLYEVDPMPTMTGLPMHGQPATMTGLPMHGQPSPITILCNNNNKGRVDSSASNTNKAPADPPPSSDFLQDDEQAPQATVMRNQESSADLIVLERRISTRRDDLPLWDALISKYGLDDVREAIEAVRDDLSDPKHRVFPDRVADVMGRYYESQEREAERKQVLG